MCKNQFKKGKNKGTNFNIKKCIDGFFSANVTVFKLHFVKKKKKKTSKKK